MKRIESVKLPTGAALMGVAVAAGLLFVAVARGCSQNELNYQLSEAVSRRDVLQIKRLLDQGADPNAPWSGYGWRDNLDRVTHRTTIFDGCTILYWTRNDPQMHRLLLRRR